MKKIILILALLLQLFAKDFKISVGVSLAPYVYFVEKIGGDFVDVSVFVPQQKNPKFYDLTYDQVKKIKDLKLLIGAGVGYETKWFDRLRKANPSLRILKPQTPCGESICYQWLSIANVEEIAQQIAHYLRMIDIKNAQNYKNNLEKFLQELAGLREEIRTIFLTATSHLKVIDYAPVWKDFSQEFNLDYVLLEDVKNMKQKWCFVTPFDPRKQIMQKYHFTLKYLFVVDPFSRDWKETLLQFAHMVTLGRKNAK